LAPNEPKLTARHESNAEECSETLTLRAKESPAATAAATFDASTDKYAPMYNEIAPPYAFPPDALTTTTQLANMLLGRTRPREETWSRCVPAARPKYSDKCMSL
jgi:hypothetical protein